MDFNGISELDEDGIIQMYNDIIIESGGDTRFAACCCYYGPNADGYWSTSSCTSWCRSQGRVFCGSGSAASGRYSCSRCK